MLASLHFNKLGNLIFFISAFITLVQAGLAIIAQTELKGYPEEDWEKHQSNLTVSIAFLAAFSVFWQSLVKNWNFNGRASLHDSAAAALGKLFKTAELKRRQEKACKTKKKAKAKAVAASGIASSFVSVPGLSPSASSLTKPPTPDDGDDFNPNPKESKQRQSNLTLGSETSGDPSTPAPAPSPEDVEDSNLFEQLVKQYEQALEGCTSFIHPRIVSAYELLDNKITVCKRKIDRGVENEDRVTVEWEKVYPTLYKELYATIITQPLWPYRVPNPKHVVNLTLQRFKAEVQPELLGILLDRNDEIEKKYDKFLNENNV